MKRSVSGRSRSPQGKETTTPTSPAKSAPLGERCSACGSLDASHGIVLPGRHATQESHAKMRAASSKKIVKGLTRAERETVAVELPDCGVVLLDSTVKTDVSRMRRMSHYYTEVSAGYHGTSEWVRFSLPADRWNSRTQKFRARRQQAPETREAASARLRSLNTRRSETGQRSGVSVGVHGSIVAESASVAGAAA